MQFTSSDLEFLDNIGGAGEENPPAVFDQGETEGGREMAFAAAGWSEQDEVGSLIEPDVAGGEGHDLRLADRGHGREVESLEGFAGWPVGFVEMPFDAAPGTSGDFVFDERDKEAGGGPALFIGAFGELLPEGFDRGEPEIAQQQGDAASVDRI